MNPLALLRSNLFSEEYRFRWFAWALATVFAAYAGPFDTFISMGFVERLFYWGTLIGVSIVLGYTIRAIAVWIVGEDGLMSDIYGSLMMTLVFGTGLSFFNVYLLGRGTLSIETWGMHSGTVLLVCIGVNGVRGYVRWTHDRAAQGSEAPAEAEAAGSFAPPPGTSQDLAGDDASFLRRLPETLGRDLKWVSADDHYLQVQTALGAERLLMRFRDALEELAELDGMQVHRSHWVARPAAVALRRDGRKYRLVTSCGNELPVSRSYLPDLAHLDVMDDGDEGGAETAARSGSDAA